MDEIDVTPKKRPDFFKEYFDENDYDGNMPKDWLDDHQFFNYMIDKTYGRETGKKKSQEERRFDEDLWYNRIENYFKSKYNSNVFTYMVVQGLYDNFYDLFIDNDEVKPYSEITDEALGKLKLSCRNDAKDIVKRYVPSQVNNNKLIDFVTNMFYKITELYTLGL